MAFSDQKQASGMIGLVVAALVVGLISRVVMAGGFENFFIPGKAEENALIEQMRENPGNDALFDALEAGFPRQYEDLTEVLAQAASGPGDESRVLNAGNAWIVRFLEAYADDFAAAPIAALDQAIASEEVLYEALREHDPLACSLVALGQDLDPDFAMESFDHLNADVMTARIVAIRAGRSDQQLRFALTPNDYDALSASLVELGMNEAQLAVVNGEAAPSSLGTAMCDLQLAYIKAVRIQGETRRALFIGRYFNGDA